MNTIQRILTVAVLASLFLAVFVGGALADGQALTMDLSGPDELSLDQFQEVKTNEVLTKYEKSQQ